MIRRLLVMFVPASFLLVGYTLAQQSKGTTSTRGKEEAIRHTLRLYEQMFVSENLDVLDEILHPMAIFCWQSENPHTLSREECRRDLRETFGRRDYRKTEICDTQIDISGKVAAVRCREIHSFDDVDFDDKYDVYMTLVKTRGRWRILTKVTTRQTSLEKIRMRQLIGGRDEQEVEKRETGK